MDGFPPGEYVKVYNFLKAFLYGLFVSLDINVDTVKILTALMVMDTVLGILKALRLEQQFSFNILTWGFVTKLAVLIVPMTLGLVGKALTFDFTWFIDATLDILVLSEGFSIITNVLAIREKKHIKNTDIMTKLLNVIRNGLMRIINQLLSTVEAGRINMDQEDQKDQP